MATMYFRTNEGLHAFAHSPIHRKAWDWWNANYRRFGHLGIMHEAYEVPRKHWENIYVNFNPELIGTMKFLFPFSTFSFLSFPALSFPLISPFFFGYHQSGYLLFSALTNTSTRSRYYLADKVQGYHRTGPMAQPHRGCQQRQAAN